MELLRSWTLLFPHIHTSVVNSNVYTVIPCNPKNRHTVAYTKNSSSAAPPLIHMLGRLVFTFPRLMSKIRVLLSLEPSVTRENGDFCIYVIKELLENRIKERLKLWCHFYIAQIPINSPVTKLLKKIGK